MSFRSNVKYRMNEWLARLNLKIETRTADRAERARLLNLEQAGHFRNQVFPVLPQIARCDPSPLRGARQASTADQSVCAAQSGWHLFIFERLLHVTRCGGRLRSRSPVTAETYRRNWLGNDYYLLRAITDGSLTQSLCRLIHLPVGRCNQLRIK